MERPLAGQIGTIQAFGHEALQTQAHDPGEQLPPVCAHTFRDHCSGQGQSPEERLQLLAAEAEGSRCQRRALQKQQVENDIGHRARAAEPLDTLAVLQKHPLLYVAALYTDAAHDQQGAYLLSTDAAAFYAARDEQYLYFSYQLQDGDPDPTTMYIAELQLFRGLYHAPADTIIMATQTPTHLWGVNVFHRESLGVEQEFDGSHVAVGSKVIEFKVPIAAIEYDGGGLFPKMGIQYRFLRAYVHYVANGDVNDPNSSYDGVADGDNRKLIINFYPTKSQPGR